MELQKQEVIKADHVIKLVNSEYKDKSEKELYKRVTTPETVPD